MNPIESATAYKIRHSHGLTETIREGGEEGYEAAIAAVRAVYGADCAIGHDGDATDGGGVTLCWTSEDAAEDDDGARAVAKIVPMY